MHSRHGGDGILRCHGHGAEQREGFIQLGGGFFQQSRPVAVFELGRLDGIGMEGERLRRLRLRQLAVVGDNAGEMDD